jgi:transposase
LRAIREILRQRYEFQRSLRAISRSTGVSYGAVQNVLSRAEAKGLRWPLPDELDDTALEAMLFSKPRPQDQLFRPLPDMATVDKALRSQKGVTLMLLWHEYKAEHPDGYQYSQFCHLYRQWKSAQDPVMRQVHRFGERAFLDFAGVRVPYVDTTTGKVREAHIFVATLGASAYISAHAFPAEDLRAWVLGTCLAFEDFGGVPAIIVPDNPKAVVYQADRYEPTINATYLEMAQHYGVVVEPARPKHPRDKAPVETGVQIVERWVLAPLRHRQFFSLEEVEAAIQVCVAEVNRRPFQKREGCRLSVFQECERPVLRPLPPARYDFAIWKKARVNIDYHIEVEKSLYSVPYHLIHQQVDVRIGTTTVAVYHRNRQVALHVRATKPGTVFPNPDHMPSSHRRHAEWTPSRILHWANEIGPKTAALVDCILKARPHPEMGFRSCLGIIRLEKRYGRERLEAACTRALAIGATSCRSVRSILEKGLDRLPLPHAETQGVPVPVHENLRGAAYYAQEVRQG